MTVPEILTTAFFSKHIDTAGAGQLNSKAKWHFQFQWHRRARATRFRCRVRMLQSLSFFSVHPSISSPNMRTPEMERQSQGRQLSETRYSVPSFPPHLLLWTSRAHLVFSKSLGRFFGRLVLFGLLKNIRARRSQGHAQARQQRREPCCNKQLQRTQDVRMWIDGESAAP